MKKQRKPVFVRLSDTTIDRDVQRALNSSHPIFKSIFDPDEFGVGIISKREDGSLVVLDGQHRTAHGIKSGFGHHEFLFFVHDGLTKDQEAAIFLAAQDRRVRVQAIDVFRLSVVAGSERHIAIIKILESFGLQVAGHQREGGVAAVASLLRIYDEKLKVPRPEAPTAAQKGQLLSRTLHVLTSAWAKERDAFDGALLDSVAAFLLKSGVTVDGHGLSKRLAKAGTPARIIGKIRSLHEAKGGKVYLAGVEQIEILANKGKRTGSR